MIKINLFDLSGIKVYPLGGPYNYKHIEYVDNLMNFDGITIFTDFHLFSNVVDKVSSKIKIAWLFEPRVMLSNIYEIYKIQDKFNFILTHDENLLNISNKYKLVSPGGCWIPDCSKKIHIKNNIVSFISSDKCKTNGHILRHHIYNTFKHRLDCFGHANFIQTKDIGLNDYMYSVCVENSSVNNYFTEKLIDCFMTGTIPIYWGCKNIFNFFNKDGMIIFENLNELDSILQNLTIEKYNSMKFAIEDNFNRANKYCVIEDWLFENFLVNIV